MTKRFSPKALQFRVGCEGFSYDQWLGAFYPEGLQQTEFLEFYSKVFDSVEINSTFYNIPQDSTVKKWAKTVPDNFVFAVKFPQGITHIGNLKESDQLTKTFLKTMSKLGNKLGPFVLQFSPAFGKNHKSELIDYLATLPQEFRYSVEIRNASWYQTDEIDALMKNLKALRIALCCTDHPTVPRSIFITTDFLYVRWQGDGRMLENASQTEERMRELKAWAETIKTLPKGVDTVYCYMNDYFSGHAPAGVNYLRECLGLPTRYPEFLWRQNPLKLGGNGGGN